MLTFKRIVKGMAYTILSKRNSTGRCLIPASLASMGFAHGVETLLSCQWTTRFLGAFSATKYGTTDLGGLPEVTASIPMIIDVVKQHLDQKALSPVPKSTIILTTIPKVDSILNDPPILVAIPKRTITQEPHITSEVPASLPADGKLSIPEPTAEESPIIPEVPASPQAYQLLSMLEPAADDPIVATNIPASTPTDQQLSILEPTTQAVSLSSPHEIIDSNTQTGRPRSKTLRDRDIVAKAFAQLRSCDEQKTEVKYDSYYAAIYDGPHFKQLPVPSIYAKYKGEMAPVVEKDHFDPGLPMPSYPWK